MFFLWLKNRLGRWITGVHKYAAATEHPSVFEVVHEKVLIVFCGRIHDQILPTDACDIQFVGV